jgi:hypothetical protein
MFLAVLLAANAAGHTVIWRSDANAVNLSSSGVPMDSGFRFELGVFAGSFVPTLANKDIWAANWRAAEGQRKVYDVASKSFASSHTPEDNVAPFSIGKTAYVWGFRGDAVSGEWILFRAASWNWPDASDFMFSEWLAKDATPVIGQINPSGSPFLMKSAAVANVAPPPTTWTQWQTEHLSSEPLDKPGDDPDHDGSPNLLEFVFGTPPKTAGAPAATPVALVGGHLQITIPRRSDHPAALTVEVSSDMADWDSGASHTQTVSDGPAALVVRDLTPLDTDHPKRFIRLRAALP